VKLETGAKLADAEPALFKQRRPTVLYNPHFDPHLTSWTRFIEPLLKAFSAQDEFNLIVAPHVKLFRFASPRKKGRWRSRSQADILVDPGSDRSVDTTYLWSSDIYVGDASSQVYEFLSRPRPCVFLNAHGVEWRDDPNYTHWHLGDVVDDVSQLMDTIRAAPARHHLYLERQQAARRDTFADMGERPSVAAAEAIMTFLRRT
jgi:CDP-glycerol glycerophosphotransferase (TagB/SpsB family)